MLFYSRTVWKKNCSIKERYLYIGGEVMKNKGMKSIISIAMSAAMLFSLAGCSKNSDGNEDAVKPGNIKAGTYSATAEGFDKGEVKVQVTVDAEGKITKVDIDAASQTPDIGGAAVSTISENIVKSQRLDCDIVSGATITSNAILEATEVALKEAGVDTEALKHEKVVAEDEEVTVDVAIVGAGASGSAAAAAAIDGGASVLMVEKTGGVGGISKMFAGGPFAVESYLQKEAGESYSKIKREDVLQTLNDYAHFINYGPLTKAIIDKSASTIEWMEEWGVTFHVNTEPPQIAHKDDEMKWKMYHWYDLFSYEAKPGDKTAIDVVHDKLLDKGIDIRFNTTCTELIKDENGAVTGFIAEREDGSKLTVNAKAVILGTGGFGGNPEMMEEYYHTTNIGMWGETGTGVQMAWNAGAAKWDTASSLFHGNGMVQPTTPGEINLGSSPFNRIIKSPLMWIDQSGNRYCNEEAVWDTAIATNTAYSVGGAFYIMVDTKTLNDYSAGNALIMDTAVGGPNMEEGDFVALAEEGVKQGIITKGETLKDLAEKLGMEEERLAKNVAEYNDVIKTKNDPYGKSEESLVYGVEEGPFYAIKMQMGNLGTLGGVRVNEKLQACDVNLKPVQGLYVVGNDAAGFYGNNTCYPPYEGLATGFAWNSGRIAGEHAAERIKAIK